MIAGYARQLEDTERTHGDWRGHVCQFRAPARDHAEMADRPLDLIVP